MKYVFVICSIVVGFLLLSLVAIQFDFTFIGEDYDTKPPKGILSAEGPPTALKLANINWRVKPGEYEKKKVSNIQVLGLKQKKIIIKAGNEVLFTYKANDGTILDKFVEITLWKDGISNKVEYKDGTFKAPGIKGTYILEIVLHAEQGTVQYVGNLVVK